MVAERAEIADRAAVDALTAAFYEAAFADPLLGPVFTASGMDLATHLPIIGDFWETVLFRAGKYHRNVLAAHTSLHARVPLTAEHFGRWLELWEATVDANFAGEKADFAKVQARRIAWSMSRRLMGESGSEFITITRPKLPPGY